MDSFELIQTLRTNLHKSLQTIGDTLMDGVDNMEKYKYLLGQAHAYSIILQEISNLLNYKEHKNEQGNVIDIGDQKGNS